MGVASVPGLGNYPRKAVRTDAEANFRIQNSEFRMAMISEQLSEIALKNRVIPAPGF